MHEATILVGWNILRNCDVGPAKNNVPHRERIFPRVTVVTNGTAFPASNDFIRKNEPRLKMSKQKKRKKKLV